MNTLSQINVERDVSSILMDISKYPVMRQIKGIEKVIRNVIERLYTKHSNTFKIEFVMILGEGTYNIIFELRVIMNSGRSFSKAVRVNKKGNKMRMIEGPKPLCLPYIELKSFNWLVMPK